MWEFLAVFIAFLSWRGFSQAALFWAYDSAINNDSSRCGGADPVFGTAWLGASGGVAKNRQCCLHHSPSLGNKQHQPRVPRIDTSVHHRVSMPRVGSSWP